VWEGNKVNPLAHWTFEECWNYLRKYDVPYHPLHDVGFSSMGDVQSTKKVPHEKWYQYAGERSGRFEGMKAKDGSAKSECGIHSFDANAK
jgi:phosphoadenosine phosphosulfate reductase